LKSTAEGVRNRILNTALQITDNFIQIFTKSTVGYQVSRQTVLEHSKFNIESSIFMMIASGWTLKCI